MSSVRPKLTDPIQLAAFGFGSGLSPWAPGTTGTVAALGIYWLIAPLPIWLYALVVLAAAFLGVWLCDRASRSLGVHDHPGIVWDEFVGMWITLWAVPVELPWILAGFVAFRFLDIVKPWPIGWLDRHTKGGFGIMIDDIAAGLVACLALHIALWSGVAVA